MGKKEEIERTKDRSRFAVEVAFLIKAVKEVLNRHRRLLWRKDDIDLIAKEIASVWLNYIKKQYGAQEDDNDPPVLSMFVKDKGILDGDPTKKENK